MCSKMRFLTFVVLIFLPALLFSQQRSVSGFVKDKATNETVIGASVYFPKLQKTVQTNASGYFSMIYESTDSIQELSCFSPGYKKVTLLFQAQADTLLTIYLQGILFNELEEVSVTADKTKQPEIGLIELPVKKLKLIPMLAGEADVIKAFQLMPGVQGGKEGTSGLYVRGGSPDQNLFLLDEIPLYYVSHIGGFVSTFDPNAINSIKLYKGGFPARYSGRLSSVIDIRTKDGNAKKRSGEIAVGLLSTKFQMDGPLGKDSSLTYLISARRFNIDIFTRILSRIDSQGESSAGYTFYDLNGKLVKRYKNNSKLSLTIYNGRDKIFINASKKKDEQNSQAYKYKSNVRWGNLMAALNYSKPLGKKAFGNLTLATTHFNYVTDVRSKYSDVGSDELSHQSILKFNSAVRDIILKTQVDLNQSANYTIKLGMNNIYHFFTPGKIESSGITANDTMIGSDLVQALENNLFIENQLKLGKRLFVNLGLNATSFSLKEKTFFSLQPRFTFNWNLYKKLSFQGGYSRMNQYMHYLSNSGAGLPSDLWIPVSKALVPEVSDQFNLGFTYLSSKSKFPMAITLEGFYKNFSNLIDYEEGANLFSAEAIENKIVSNGKGKVYGVELLIQKSIGKTTGWIAYTLSKNTRTFEEINGGKTFPYKFDRRHSASVVISHAFTENIQLTATWVYATGNAITLAQGKYSQIDLGQYYFDQANAGNFQLNEAHQYNGKNGFRMPAYHKLDVGINLSKKKRRGTRTWNFGIYNVYNQQNPFMLFYKKNKQQEIKLHQLTLFPIIPSVSYSFVF